MSYVHEEDAGAKLPRVMIIIASTRPGRAGLPVGEWVEREVRKHGGFEVAFTDLAELNLPFMDEPNHPRLRQYVHQHTKDWSAKVAACDAFIVVTPEYNHSMNAPLKNALDYLLHEWQYKPVAFVSYGGISAGTRAVQVLKQVVAALKMMAIPEAVNIPFVHQFIDEERNFQPNDATERAVPIMLNELHRWAVALQPMRQRVAHPS